MKKKITVLALLGLTVLVMSGCGREEKEAVGSVPGNAASDSDAADSGASDSAALDGGTASDGGAEEQPEEPPVRQEPPQIELHPAAGEGDSLMIKACGYTWNWPEGADQMGAAIADSAAPLSEGAPWDILILPGNGDDSQEYGLTTEVNPDELGVTMWNQEDIGNYEAQGSRTAVYEREEIAADYIIPLQAGKVYEIYLSWDEENVGENGCFGTAYYVFKTDGPMQGTEGKSDGLTGLDNREQSFPEATFGDVDAEEIIPVDGVTMTVTKATSEGASLEILNRTDKELTLGEDYELQVWEGENWHRVDYIVDNWAFNMVAYIPDKDEPMRMDVTWTYFHGILPEGRYRITKTADIQEAEGRVTFRLAAEFTVE